MKYYEEFLEDSDYKNLKTNYKSLFDKITNIDNSFELFLCNNIQQFNNLFVNMKCISRKTIATNVSLLKSYTRWCLNKGCETNKNTLKLLESLDINDIWDKTKHSINPKFINYLQYCDIIHELEWEEFNTLYYQTLFMAIYEGIYDTQMYSLRYLRTSEIKGNQVVLHQPDTKTHILTVSEKLISNLYELSNYDRWFRKHGRSERGSAIDMYSEHPDNPFKIVVRRNGIIDDDTYKSFYYNKLKTIYKNYIGYKVEPKNLYLSGIMHRFQISCKEKGYDVKDIFTLNKRNQFYSDFIDRELKKTGMDYDVYVFRNAMIDYVYLFEE